MSERPPIVPRAARDAFGARGEAVALDGGEGVTVRIARPHPYHRVLSTLP